jgi:NADH-quinone oxidoreductase subunit M
VSSYFITVMIALPFLGAMSKLLVARVERPRLNEEVSKWIGLLVSTFSSVIGFALVFLTHLRGMDSALSERIVWVDTFSIAYEVSISGINALPVLLISLVFPILILSRWEQRENAEGMQGMLLLLQGMLLGAVCSADLFLMVFFWSMTMLPLYFMLALFGGQERERAAFRMVVGSSIGNAIWFIVLVLVFYGSSPHTLSLQELIGGRLDGQVLQWSGFSIPLGSLAYWLLVVGLMARVPVWPVHGWFLEVARQASPVFLAAMSGVFIPVALTLFGRLSFTLFPKESALYAPVILVLGALSALTCSLVSIAQKEFKQLIGYLTPAMVGLLLVGYASLDPAGVVGSVFQAFGIGISFVGFSLLVAAFQDRSKTTVYQFPEGERPLGGLANRAPVLAMFVVVFVVGLIGFPGAVTFVGSALIFMGGYAVHPGALVVGLLTSILVMVTLFSMFRSVFLGAAGAQASTIEDLGPRERLYLVPLIAGLLVFGFYPRPLLDLIRPAVLTLLSIVS